MKYSVVATGSYASAYFMLDRLKLKPERTIRRQKSGECILLGLNWNEEKDTLGVTFPMSDSEPRKRGILSKVANIYDPLGLVFPVTFNGKVIYREACNEKCTWVVRRWRRWTSMMVAQVDI